MSTLTLFPELQPYQQELLSVNTRHQIYVEQNGNPNGLPVIFLHGGPGSGCNPGQRRFFDPAIYRIILFDQRGCGRSLPAGEIRENTTADLVADIEKIRQHLNIAHWHVFGGSWGSTLALAYASQHPQAVLSLVLRGIFLSRPHEIDWFLGQVALFFPEAWEKLISRMPAGAQRSVLDYYAGQVWHADTAVCIPAATAWNAFESSIMCLLPKEESGTTDGGIELARARVQIHYIQHLCFVDGQQLLQQAKTKLAQIPTIIVQGRYDMVCPPQTAYELKQAMPHAQWVMVPDAGHSAMEPGTCQALLAATEAMKSLKHS